MQIQSSDPKKIGQREQATEEEAPAANSFKLNKPQDEKNG
jgi:hypothetical protein